MKDKDKWLVDVHREHYQPEKISKLWCILFIYQRTGIRPLAPIGYPPYIQLQKYNRHRQFSTWFVTTICHLILPLSFITYLFLFFLYSFVCSCFIRSFFAVVLASCRVPCCATSCPSLVPRCCPCYCQCWYYRLALSSHPAPHLTILLVYVQRCNGGDWYGVPI